MDFITRDQNAGNDGIITDYISTVTGIPYIPDFGTTSQKSEELSFWTIVNKNGDYYTFSAGSDNSLNTNVFSYGGGIIGQSLVTIPNPTSRFVHAQFVWKQEYNTNYHSFPKLVKPMRVCLLLLI